MSAEAEIHNTSIETVHFHEVGAVDADGRYSSAPRLGAEVLDVDEWICSPLNVGRRNRQVCSRDVASCLRPQRSSCFRARLVYSSGPAG